MSVLLFNALQQLHGIFANGRIPSRMFPAALLLREILNFVINGQIQMEGKGFDDFIYLLNGTDKNNIFSE